MNRRRFLASSAAGLSAASYTSAAQQPNERVRLAVMGVRSRGRDHVRGFSAFDDVDIACICEIDDSLIPNALRAVNARQQQAPRVERDIRRVLEDNTITGLVIAAPDHWHALATVWACQAGKHVYVEKPISHNLVEGRRMVQAAQRHRRHVQVGTQRRSAPQSASAVELIRAGRLGKIPFARTWIAGNRPTIGRRADSAIPQGVDYDLWLGPAPQRPFNVNHFHYNWHWQWVYGTGELGNNGIHGLDLIRLLLDLDTPTRISSGGGKLFYEDDQETPDTQVVTFDFPNTTVLWEHRIWSRTGCEGQSWGVTLYGERGTMNFTNRGWTVTDGIEANAPNADMERPHQRNFIDAIKNGQRLNAPVEEGHKSTRLCHLGNIAQRVGRSVRFDARTETIIGDEEANRLLGRTYRRPFVLPEV